MNTTVLLAKLIDIERYVGVEPDAEIRRKVIDIEEYVLRMQTESAEGQRHAMVATAGKRFHAQTERTQSDAGEALNAQEVISCLSQFPSISNPAPIRIDQAQGASRRRLLSFQRLS
jgi:hypothetical protein